MSSSRSRERRLLIAGVAAFWGLLAIVSLGNDVVREVVNDCSPTVGQALARLPDFARREVAPFLLWALLTPALFALAARLPVTRPKAWRRVPLHLSVALAVATGVGAYRAAAHDLLAHSDPASGHALAEWRRGGFVAGLPLDLPAYSAILVVGFALAHYRGVRRREAEAARLEAQATELRARLAEARFEALRHQLHPHFLFNTLNTVAALVERDPAATRKTVARLSGLLRRALDGGDRHEVTLAEELSFVEGYLEIERTRFGDRFAVRLRIEDEARQALVPSLVLQPLVENAVRHGIARAAGPGRIWIEAAREGGRLRLRVRDNGPGCGPGPPRAGVGLSNTAGRLEALHGAAATLELSSQAGGGFEASIVLPLRFPDAGQGEVESVAV